MAYLAVTFVTQLTNRVDSADLAIYAGVSFLSHRMRGTIEAAECWVKKNDLPGIQEDWSSFVNI